MYVHVPAGLWELLEAGDFDEVETAARSAGELLSVTEAVLSAGEHGVGLTTGLVGVYLAREQIGDFVNRVAAWLGLRARTAGGPQQVTFAVTSGPEAARTRVEISCPAGPDGLPLLDP